MPDSLRSATLKGLSWSFIGQIIKQVCAFVFNVMLARLLTPADFGLTAMAGVFINFALIFADVGISSALIQRKHVTEEHWSSAFWLNIVMGVFLTALFIVLSPWIALFYNRPELGKIIAVLSLNFVLSSLTMVQQSILTKDMRFLALMVRDVSAVFISGTLAVYLALHGWGVWSLVVQLLTFTAVNNVFLWSSSQWRPRFIFSIVALKDFFGFSANLTGFSILNYFARNLDQLLIGKFLGSQALGYYSLAYKLMMLPLQNISWVLSKVMFPVLSKVQDDKERFHRAYFKLLKTISILAFPAMALCYVLAPEIVYVAYGPKWAVVSDLVRILSFCGMFQSVGTIAGLIYQSVGKTYVQLRMGIINTIAIFLTLFFCIQYGLYGVTLGYTIFSIVWVHISAGVVARVIGIPYWRMYSALLPAFLLTGVLFVVMLGFKSVIVASPWVTMFLVGIVFLLVYVLMLFVQGELKVRNRRLVVDLLN